MNRYAMSVAVLAVTGSVCAQAVQWTQAEGGNGHWYAVIDGFDETWFDHRDRAMAMGGDLACVANESENEFILGLQIGSGHCDGYVSLGGLQVQGEDEPAGGWYWVSGEPWSYTNWHPNGEPNDQGEAEWALFFHTADGCLGLWNDADPEAWSSTAAMAIEWSADCNGDGIVDYGQILDGTYADDDGNGVPDCCDAGEPCDAVQWIEADGGNGHWYQFISEYTDWNTASVSADEVGGHLATVQNVNENNFIKSIVPSEAWLGGTDEEQEGTWVWENGDPWSYTNWRKGSPNNANGDEHYLILYSDGSGWPGWDDKRASAVSAYTIEWSADCNDDGIIDFGQILDGTYADDDGNGVPDCCEFPGGCEDCNDNGVLDSEDLANGTSQDCNANDIPDECDIADGTSLDCNNNDVPDECESLADCDGDGTSDVCEILGGALDVNPADGVPDECQGLLRGACCYGGGCVMSTLDDCFTAAGSYAGDGISCADAGCPPDCPTDVFEDGVTDVNDLLLILSEFGSVCP